MIDPPARFKDLCLDARDHQALADWWCAALGYVRRPSAEPRDPGWPVPIEDPAGAGPLIWPRAGEIADLARLRGP
ncbi:MAG TPA: VOC family protein [Geodermatophilus sp.]|nr:VOC family protein [Geodermatophilus sp.]